MKKIVDYKNKKVLVLGLAKSGFSAAKLLHDLGALVTVNDGKPFEENPEAQDLLTLGIKVITGSHPIELLDEDFSLVVKNPGIPYTQPLVKKAVEKKIPILTEVELAYQVSDAPIIGITGTNGKTTTTTMIGQVLNAGMSKGTARLSGNIGYPASSVAQEAVSEDYLVMELSSFQLMGIETFHPAIAVITNLYEAHLDYHGSREEYVAAKWQIQKNMTSQDAIVLNWNQQELQELAKTTKARVVPFSTQEVVAGAYELDGQLYFKDEIILPVAELGVPGKHNIENALAAIAVAKLSGIDNQSIAEALRTFSGVPHRTQYVGKINDVRFFNDSKATNILATEMALGGFEHEKLILLAGGLDRGNGFEELIPSLKGIKAIVLFGETKYKLEDAAKQAGIPIIRLTDNVETAVPLAFELSIPGDTILLSPANASWDQYPNFEVRGERYIEAMKALK
ncbi:UDP-N-acetylmuramoyl-L-alanine--D-glutamate ligase [Enterococcus saccharolyticus]|uniref:UDP-N-acetylmuramoylalanine--D-glutamate ligase n=1 Tax=Candidatus Enterococcus willemsii TaxID=1857215 RepID=A0ABQ6YYK0_9ENTE|nr:MULTISPECIES: UDP-N-acetylmuramoyl-L-alanine--D-glutamate ligase [Enterococcus]KAF1303246.1 UDP-N-acetylmuramoyl-L-alanine--D-glutamate ligase [Enterococcus sp. CU12B]MCD5001789.1 UDP-N-acetylmuramoyl-L-alanine--D-glutamate ligase [Enterococcus saccharolyticus]